MTENKRWKIIEEQFISYYGGCGYKISNGECGFWLWHSKEESQKVCDKLNELNDENDVLKQQLKTKYIVNKQYEELQKVKEENEQLKQFQDSVFSWIDMHLQRLPTLRDDEFESDNEFADPSLYSGAIQILETMKRELKR